MVKMTFIALMDQEEHRLEVDDNDRDDGTYTVELDGKKYQVDAHTMPSEIVTALINHKSYDLDLDDKDQNNDPLDGRLSIRVRGRVLRFEMLAERRKKMKDAQSSQFAQSGLAQICSPMPGKVLRYLVAEGEEVKEGQGLVVVEAMKMENELQAPKSGEVKSINSKEGTAVNQGTLLLTIA